MECMEVRKKLEEYARDEIKDKELINKMEAHIDTCPICKKELFMWQEVLENQRTVSRMQATGMPKELKDRIKYRTSRSEKISKMPAFFRTKRAPGGFWNSILGMIIQITFILACGIVIVSGPILGLFRFKQQGRNMVAILLIIFGFAVLSVLMIMKGRKKP